MDILRLAWKETELADPKKVYSGLFVGVLFYIFTWFAGLQQWQQVLFFIGCSVAAYSVAVLVQFSFRCWRNWLSQRGRIAISSIDELIAHDERIHSEWDAIQTKIVELKDSMNGSREMWQEWLNNKDDKFAQYIDRRFKTEIEITEIETFRAILIGDAKDMREKCERFTRLLNFDFKPLV